MTHPRFFIEPKKFIYDMLVGYKHRDSKGFMDFSNANPYKMIH